MSTLAQLSPGSVFAHDFRVVRPLADGGMGSVYVVEQLSTGRERALKLMHPQFVADPSNRRRFAEEARAGSRIESDHVVEVIASGVDDASGVPWLAMELLHGETLFERVERRGPLPPAEAYEVLRQVCHALGAAHRAGLVHRDVKPENIFLASTRREGASVMVKVLDFGIAKVVQDARGVATGSMGTPLWMAPEQSEAQGIIGPPTDVWAIGLVAFYLLTGRSFWTSGSGASTNVPAMMRELLFGAMPAASMRAAELGVGSLVPSGFDAWFARAVVRDAARRFPDAAAAAVTLEAALKGSTPARTVALAAVAPGVPALGAAPAAYPPTLTALPGAAPPAAPGAWPATIEAPAMRAARAVDPLAPTAPAPRPRSASRAPWIVGAVVLLAAGGGLAAVLSWRDAAPRTPVTAATTVAPTQTPAVVPTPAPTRPTAPAPSRPTGPAPIPPATPAAAHPSAPVHHLPVVHPRPTPTTTPSPTTPATPTPTPAPDPTPTPTPAPDPTPAPPDPTPAPTADVPPGRPPRGNLPFDQIFQQGREQAALQFERYLQQNPNAPDREAIQQRINALRSRAAPR